MKPESAPAGRAAAGPPPLPKRVKPAAAKAESSPAAGPPPVPVITLSAVLPAAESSPAAVARLLWLAARRLSLLCSAIGGVAIMLALLPLLAGCDYFGQFGFAFRLLLFALLVAGISWCVRRLRRRYPPLADLSAAACVIERAFPALRALFLTAVEADGGRVSGDPRLVQRVIAQAQERVGREAVNTLDRRGLVFWRRVAYGLCIGWLLALCLAPEAVWRHSARVLLPLARIDPCFATKLEVSPGDARVVKGDSVTIQVVARGALPDFAEIEMWQGDDAVATRLSMSANGVTETERRFAFTLYQVQEDVRYRIYAGDAFTYEFTIVALEAPRVEHLFVTVLPPQYSAAAPVTDTDPAELTMLARGGLELTVLATLPLAAAECGVQTATRCETLPMSVHGATATFTLPCDSYPLPDSGTVCVILTAVNGVSARGGVWRLTVIPDPPPVVRLDWPGTEIKAFATEEIPFAARLHDNLALTEVRVGVGIGADSEVLWRTLPLRRVSDDSCAFVLPLEDFALEMGDVVSVRIEARDENPAPGAASQTVLIEILPYEKFYRYDPNPLNGQQLGQLLQDLQEFIAREKQVIVQTVPALDRDAVALAAPATAQRALSEDVGRAVEVIRLALRAESAGGAEVMVALEAARESMDEAVRSLQAGDGHAGYGFERAALDRLMKAFRALLTIISPSNTQPQSGSVVNDEDMPREELPQNRQYQDTQNQNGQQMPREQQTRELLDQARRSLEQMQAQSGAQTGEAVRQLAAAMRQLAEQLAAAGDQRGAGALRRQAEQLAQAGSPRDMRRALSGAAGELEQVRRARPNTAEGRRAGELAERARRLEQQMAQAGENGQAGQGQAQGQGQNQGQNQGQGQGQSQGRQGQGEQPGGTAGQRRELAGQAGELADRLAAAGDQRSADALRRQAQRLSQARDGQDAQNALGELAGGLGQIERARPNTAEGRRAGELANRARQMQGADGNQPGGTAGQQGGRGTGGRGGMTQGEREELARQLEQLAGRQAARGSQGEAEKLRQLGAGMRQANTDEEQGRALAAVEGEAARLGGDPAQAELARQLRELAARGQNARRQAGASGTGGENRQAANQAGDRGQQLQENLAALENGAQQLAQRLAREGDRENAVQLQRLTRQLQNSRSQGAVGAGDRYGDGNGRVVGALAELVKLLTKLNEDDLAADAARAALRELETDPDKVPPELRELVRRYFEMLRQPARGAEGE